MSKNFAVNMPVGGGIVYWNNIRIGSSKGDSALHWEGEQAEGEVGESIGIIAARIIRERGSVDLNIGDFKIEQLRHAFGLSKSAASSTILASATTNANLRKAEAIGALAEGGIATLSEGGFDTGSLVLNSHDYVSEFTKGTDYTADEANGQITRLSAGSIQDNQELMAAYNFIDAGASVIKVGGRNIPYEAELRIVWELSDGKLLQFRGYRAIRTGPLDITLPEEEFQSYPLSFKLLNDLSKAKGEQLFEWAKEA